MNTGLETQFVALAKVRLMCRILDLSLDILYKLLIVDLTLLLVSFSKGLNVEFFDPFEALHGYVREAHQGYFGTVTWVLEFEHVGKDNVLCSGSQFKSDLVEDLLLQLPRLLGTKLADVAGDLVHCHLLGLGGVDFIEEALELGLRTDFRHKVERGAGFAELKQRHQRLARVQRTVGLEVLLYLCDVVVDEAGLTDIGAYVLVVGSTGKVGLADHVKVLKELLVANAICQCPYILLSQEYNIVLHKRRYLEPVKHDIDEGIDTDHVILSNILLAHKLFKVVISGDRLVDNDFEDIIRHLIYGLLATEVSSLIQLTCSHFP